MPAWGCRCTEIQKTRKDRPMTVEPRREWTQYEIVEETRRRHSGEGFFNVLHEACEEAFGGATADPLVGETGSWWFLMGELTIGELLDFFTSHKARPAIHWSNQTGGPTAYVVIGDLNLADKFRTRFETDALSAKE